MHPAAVVRRAEGYLARHGVENPRGDAEVLLGFVLGTDRAGLYARTDPLGPQQARAFGRALCARGHGTPLQHLTGDQPFRHLDLEVRPGVFIPRPETEVVVDVVLSRLAERVSPVVVDVGTGTGAIALAIKYERSDAEVLATDVSEEAVELARRNSERLGLSVTTLLGEFLQPLPGSLRGRVDAVVSNPPYVTRVEHAGLAPDVLADPATALVGGPGVFTRLRDAALGWLAEDGWLVAEIGATQGGEVARIFGEGLAAVGVLEDLAGRPRVVVGRRP